MAMRWEGPVHEHELSCLKGHPRTPQRPHTYQTRNPPKHQRSPWKRRRRKVDLVTSHHQIKLFEMPISKITIYRVFSTLSRQQLSQVGISSSESATPVATCIATPIATTLNASECRPNACENAIEPSHAGSLSRCSCDTSALSG